jgi:hypothetical protein
MPNFIPLSDKPLPMLLDVVSGALREAGDPPLESADMPGSRRGARRAAWIALGAVLVGSVVPAAAHADPTIDRGGTRADRCSATGTAPVDTGMPNR